MRERYRYTKQAAVQGDDDVATHLKALCLEQHVQDTVVPVWCVRDMLMLNCISLCVHIYLYIYIERERERHINTNMHIHTTMYISYTQLWWLCQLSFDRGSLLRLCARECETRFVHVPVSACSHTSPDIS